IWKKCRFIGSYFRWSGTIIWETKSTWDGFNTSSWYGYYGYFVFLINFYKCLYIVKYSRYPYYFIVIRVFILLQVRKQDSVFCLQINNETIAIKILANAKFTLAIKKGYRPS